MSQQYPVQDGSADSTEVARKKEVSKDSAALGMITLGSILVAVASGIIWDWPFGLLVFGGLILFTGFLLAIAGDDDDFPDV